MRVGHDPCGGNRCAGSALRIAIYGLTKSNFRDSIRLTVHRGPAKGDGSMASVARVIPVHKIYLDNDNPRHPPIDSEGEIMGKLFTNEKVKGLAEDIVAYGVSPLDRMGVIPHPKVPGAFIAVEGNRRLCALKLLSDPEKAPTEPARKAFRNLKLSLPTPIKNVEVVVFETRDDARHWMRIRHEGELNGAGTKSWRAPQITRFNAGGDKVDNPNVLAHELLAYALKRKLINQEEHDQTKITTLTRFLNGPVFRDTLAITSHRQLETDAPQEEFDRGIDRFLRDARTAKSDVHSRTTIQDREKYAKRLVKEGVAPETRTSSPVRLHPESGRMDTPKDKGGQSENKSPDKRKHVIPPNFRCVIRDKVHKRIYDELKNVDAQEHPFASAYLLRAFIEITTRAFCKKYKISPAKPDLHMWIGKAADYLQQQNGVDPRTLKALRVMATERDSGYSPESLGAAVHGGGLIPTRTDLNRYWDSLESGLRLMLDRL